VPAGGGVIAALVPPLLIAAVTLVTYANSFAIPFIFDDFFEITGNPAVKSVEPLWRYATRSRGLPSLTFALNYRWDGFDVWGYHLVNLLVHLANGLLVYALVQWTLRLPQLRGRYQRSARWLAMLVALVFVAHPLQTMAASYIVQRAESMAACFYLATLLLFAIGSVAAAPRTRRLCYAGAALTAVLGVLSKEIVATVAVAALLYRWCFLARVGAERSRLRTAAIAALLVLPLLYGLLLAWPYLYDATESFDSAGPRAWLYIPTAGFSVQGVGSWRYLLTELAVIVWYLRLFVLPTPLTFDYGWPFVDSVWRADVLLPLVVLLAIVALAVASYRRYPLATFCIGWVFITLAPTSSIVPLRDAAFEHRMYLPIIGLAWLIVVGGYDLSARLAAWLGQPVAAVRRIGGVVAALWIAGLAAATVARNEVLAEPLALAEDSVAKAPNNWRAHYALADELTRRKREDQAITEFEESIRLDPQQGAPRVQLGGIYIARRRYADAERVLTPATELMEESVVAAAYLQLAGVHQARGETDQAIMDLQHVIALKPEWLSPHLQLAKLFARRGAWFAAAGAYGDAVALKPDRADLRNEAAMASYAAARIFHEDGRPHAAQRMLEKVTLYRPGWAASDHYLGYMLAERGRWDDAQVALERAAAADPSNAMIAENLRRIRAREPLLMPPDEGPPRTQAAAPVPPP